MSFGASIDFLGREIHLGDVVVYPRRNGSSIWLGKANVVNIQATADGHLVKVRSHGAKGYRTGIVPAERCVVVQLP